MVKLSAGIVALVVLLYPNVAKADLPCIADAEGVRHLYPNSYPSWTYQLPNHKGEQCWFPAHSKGEKKWNRKYFDRVPDVDFEHIKTTKDKPKPLKRMLSDSDPNAIGITDQKPVFPAEVQYVTDTSVIALRTALEKYAAKLREQLALRQDIFMMAGLIK